MENKLIKVLIIDDDPDICFFLKQGLQRTGKYKVLAAKEGSSGSVIASCRGHKPDIIILDIMMSGMDGFDVLRKLRADSKTMYIPVIMCTALTDLSSKIKAEGLYCDDYIVKPVTIDDIKLKVESVLVKRGIKI